VQPPPSPSSTVEGIRRNEIFMVYYGVGEFLFRSYGSKLHIAALLFRATVMREA